ncbi:MAG: hypothetical protein B6I34_03890 [Anaerolineaceae bacterium 4572_32.1]|nr:MAG: hypothetical protein B6I34_03890 [Anaerolineaceae bacterium 4572_32.1]
MSTELQVSHVADFYRRYPGEAVILYTRVDVPRSLPSLTVHVALPAGLEPEGARVLSGEEVAASLETLPEAGDRQFTWKIERELPAGARCEFQVRARVAPTARDVTLKSRARAVCQACECVAEETVTIAVSARGRYLAYLPALYHDDEFLARFLMLFESFWAPIERQIDHLSFYLDPKLTPPDFLPWLASWLDLTLDERWPEEKQRQMMCAAVPLYRKRGTKRGLQEYLELYTGVKPQIVERRAQNFNRRVIESIIEAEKPAHTDYTLHLEIER